MTFGMTPMPEIYPEIYVDGDACPVKQEVLRVAGRHGLKVHLVGNTWLRGFDSTLVEQVVVAEGADAADDWIVEQAGSEDVVISSDIPLASRCLEKGAQVLGPKGRDYTDENIGDALASRELSSQLREMGAMTGGPAPFQKRDRSRFLHRLDEIIQSLRRKNQGRRIGD